ncbi:MAG: alpha-glucosidase C-terminal domain-containing protein [Bacteroidetes bacterium]|nr:alpha-glucosidase C-terminal domain-containing protein [Bacteroidota bacterium]
MKTLLLIFIGLIAMNSAHSQISPLKFSLNGEWLFKADTKKVGVKQKWFAETSDRSKWEKINVPDFWEDHSNYKNYDGWGWYARKFEFNKTSEPFSIHFAGVDDDAVVWINGINVGSHTGYSDPFALDVTDALRNGENMVVVQVLDYGGGGGIYKPVTIIETKHLDSLLKSEYFGKPALQSTDWVKDAVIYSAYLRSASPEGTFKGFEKRIPELKEMGVTVVWLLPIHPVGVKNRKGKLGSPYSVRDFYGINPEFGTMNDFKNLLNTVHKNSMKLIIDLVANHTAWDNPMIVEHPEWFTKDSHGKIIPPNDDWTDVADLDYSKPELRKYMIDMMKWWVKDVDIDGFRCDVAELVPTDFWEEARDSLNKIKDVMMLSEGSIPEHHLKAFDLTYSWNIYDVLELLLKSKRPATVIDQLLNNESLQFPTGSLRMRFNTNHDKNAWDEPAVKMFGIDGLKLTAILINTIPGVPMIYTGEEVANDKKLGLFEKVDVDWKRPKEMQKIYSDLFKLRKESKALSRGEMFRVTNSDDKNVYAFMRVSGDEKIIVLLNFSKKEITTQVEIPVSLFDVKNIVTLNEVFTGMKMKLSKKNADKFNITLKPYGYKVFVVEKD